MYDWSLSLQEARAEGASARMKHNCLTWALLRWWRFGGVVFVVCWARGSWPHFAWRSGAYTDPWALHWRAEDRDLHVCRQPLPFKGAPALIWVGGGVDSR